MAKEGNRGAMPGEESTELKVNCCHCHAVYAVEVGGLAGGIAIRPRYTCPNCKKTNELLIQDAKVMDLRKIPDLEPPVINCLKIQPWLKEYLEEAYRSYNGGAYTAASMACRLTLDGLLHWLGYTASKLADKMDAVAKGANVKHVYIRKQLPSLEALKGMGDFAGHHQANPGIVAEPTARTWIQVITGIIVYIENDGGVWP